MEARAKIKKARIQEHIAIPFLVCASLYSRKAWTATQKILG